MKRSFALSLIIAIFSANIAYTQDAVNLDKALQDIAYHFDRQLPAHSVVAVLNITSEHQTLSSYIIDELISNIINLRNLIPVDRRNLEAIQTEIAFHLSGYVSDESAMAIGKTLGAQTIISGEISLVNSRIYHLSVRAVNVETAAIQGTVNRNIIVDRKFRTLTGNTNNFAVSIGGGIRLGGAFTEGAREESGRENKTIDQYIYNTAFLINETTGRSGFDIGAFAFLDLKYAVINMSLYNSSGNIRRSWSKEYYYNNRVLLTEEENDTGNFSALLFNIGGFLKYPFHINSITLFPTIGAEYQLWLSQTENGQRTRGDLSANNALWLKFGGGIDYNFTRSLFIRGNLLWGIKLDSRNERRDAFSYFTHGPTVNIGIGYIFNRR